MSNADDLTTADEVRQADEARAALVSDIHDLKEAGQAVVAKAESNLPWVLAGAVGVAAIGLGVSLALQPKRRWFEPKRRSLFGKVLRAAALSAAGIVARRLAARAVTQALPEPATAGRVAASGG